MQAIVYQRYGPPEVTWLKEVAQPVLTQNDVLVKVEAASVTTADWRLRAFCVSGDYVAARPLDDWIVSPKA